MIDLKRGVFPKSMLNEVGVDFRFVAGIPEIHDSVKHVYYGKLSRGVGLPHPIRIPIGVS